MIVVFRECIWYNNCTQGVHAGNVLRGRNLLSLPCVLQDLWWLKGLMIYKHHYHCHPYQLINYHCHFYHVNNYHPLNNHRSQARDCTTCYPEHRLYVSTCVSNCPEGSRPSTQVLPLVPIYFQEGAHLQGLSWKSVITPFILCQTHTCLACPHACSSCEGEGR